MSLLQSYDVKWPNSTRQVLTWSKIVNIGVSITAPDCFDYNWTFLLLYIVTMASPVRNFPSAIEWFWTQETLWCCVSRLLACSIQE